MTHRIRIGLHLKTTISIMQEPKLWNQMGSLLNNIIVKPNLTSWSTLEYQTSTGTVNNRQRAADKRWNNFRRFVRENVGASTEEVEESHTDVKHNPDPSQTWRAI